MAARPVVVTSANFSGLYVKIARCRWPSRNRRTMPCWLVDDARSAGFASAGKGGDTRARKNDDLQAACKFPGRITLSMAAATLQLWLEAGRHSTQYRRRCDSAWFKVSFYGRADMKLSIWSAAMVAAISLSGCVDLARIRAENRAADQRRCSDYGYEKGDDTFANCMKRSDEKREYAEQRAEDRKARIRALALKRSGDGRYPICSAATPNVELDVAEAWYAEGCRAR
jgi:hypothetical protein